MDIQWLFNALWAVLMLLGGWVLKTVHGDTRTTKKDFDDYREYVNETFARRDDLKDHTDRIYRILERIETKIDQHG